MARARLDRIVLLIGIVLMVIAMLMISGREMVRAGDGDNLKTDLIAWYDLDEESGTRYDETDNSHDLTDNNSCGYDTGVVGNSADMIASNSEYLSAADHADFSPVDGDMSIMVWFRADNYSSNQGLVAKRRFSNSTGEYYLQLDTASNLEWRTVDASDDSSANCELVSSLSTDTWYMVVVQRDGSEDKNYVYLNGNTSSQECGGNGDMADREEDFWIGRVASSYFDGEIDLVAYWDRMLTSDERTWLYNSGSGRQYSDLPGGVITPTATLTPTATTTPTLTATPTATITPTATTTPTVGTPVPLDYTTWSIDLPSGGEGSVLASLTAGEAMIVIVLLAILFLGLVFFIGQRVWLWLQR